MIYDHDVSAYRGRFIPPHPLINFFSFFILLYIQAGNVIPPRVLWHCITIYYYPNKTHVCFPTGLEG